MANKHIQVFLDGDGECEVSSILEGMKVHEGLVWLELREEDGLRLQYVIPVAKIKMIRIFDESED